MLWLDGIFALLAILSFAVTPARSMGFVAAPGFTLRDEAAREDAQFVVVGTFHCVNEKSSDRNQEFQISSVLRSHPSLGDRKVLPVPSGPVDRMEKPVTYVVFGCVEKDKFDLYRGFSIRTESGLEYVKTVLTMRPKGRIADLVFFSRFLDHTDAAIADDAYLELSQANDEDLREAMGKMSADRLRACLKDPKTPVQRLALIATLLGGCGNGEDAAYLLGQLTEPTARTLANYTGFLKGYLLLRPKEGWDFALKLANDGEKPFEQRIAIVRALDYFRQWQPKENRDVALKLLGALLPQKDIGDVAIDRLRRWKMWEMADCVVALQENHGKELTPGIRRELLLYALCCKENPAVEAFLEDQRVLDPDIVMDAEEYLSLEKAVIGQPNSPGK
jgi:hypothetical protein